MLLSAVCALILMAPIDCRGSISEQVRLNFPKTVQMKKQTHLHLGWPEGEQMFSNYFFVWGRVKGGYFNHGKITVIHNNKKQS